MLPHETLPSRGVTCRQGITPGAPGSTKIRPGFAAFRAAVGRGAQVIAATSAVAGFEAGAAAEVNEPAGGQCRGEEGGKPQRHADRPPALLEGVSRIDES